MSVSLNIIPDEGFVCEDFWKEKKKIRRIAKNIDRCDLKNNVRERSLSVVYHFKKFPPLLTFTPWHGGRLLAPDVRGKMFASRQRECNFDFSFAQSVF